MTFRGGGGVALALAERWQPEGARRAGGSFPARLDAKHNIASPVRGRPSIGMASA